MSRILTSKVDLAILLAYFLSIRSIHAQTKAPQGIIMPWESPSVDREILLPLKKDMAKARQAFIEKTLAQTQNFTDYALAQKKKLTLNATRHGKGIWVGNLQDPSPEALVFQPLFCQVRDQFMVGFVAYSFEDGLLKGGNLRAIPKKAIQNIQKDEELSTLLQSNFSKAFEYKMNQLAQQKDQMVSAFKIGLSLSRNTQRQELGSNLCLNQALSLKLSENYRTTQEIGNHGFLFVRRILGKSNQLARATRRLTIDWQHTKKTSWPIELKISVRKGESVFGSPIKHQAHSAKLIIDDQGHFDLEMAEALTKYLERESQALLFADLPEVIHIDRSWAYLDRGRAWGLKMTDRLIHDTNGGIIKGHIVGFYGSRLGLKSKDGVPINEGAILYIRTGRGQLSLGQRFGYDPTSFPTVWPPVKTP